MKTNIMKTVQTMPKDLLRRSLRGSSLIYMARVNQQPLTCSIRLMVKICTDLWHRCYTRYKCSLLLNTISTTPIDKTQTKEVQYHSQR